MRYPPTDFIFGLTALSRLNATRYNFVKLASQNPFETNCCRKRDEDNDMFKWTTRSNNEYKLAAPTAAKWGGSEQTTLPNGVISSINTGGNKSNLSFSTRRDQ